MDKTQAPDLHRTKNLSAWYQYSISSIKCHRVRSEQSEVVDLKIEIGLYTLQYTPVDIALVVSSKPNFLVRQESLHS